MFQNFIGEMLLEHFTFLLPSCKWTCRSTEIVFYYIWIYEIHVHLVVGTPKSLLFWSSLLKSCKLLFAWDVSFFVVFFPVFFLNFNCKNLWSIHLIEKVRLIYVETNKNIIVVFIVKNYMLFIPVKKKKKYLLSFFFFLIPVFCKYHFTIFLDIGTSRLETAWRTGKQSPR